MGITPNGQERIVQPDELFFSTTDTKGVITSVNSVFKRLSVYSETELVGSAHNILRHPDMPAGAFYIIWEAILAGKPAVAYVLNLAKDSVSYWTLATITPIENGFLSVRSAPQSARVKSVVDSLYADALKVEKQIREDGGSKAAAAVKGAEIIQQGVRRHGFHDMDEFMRHLLPSEISRISNNQDATALILEAGRLQNLLQASFTIESALTQLLTRLDDYVAIAAELTSAQQTSALLDSAVSTASEASQVVSQASPVLGKAGQAAVALSSDMIDAMQRLTLSLEVTKELTVDLRLRIALAKLHTDMISSFIVEVSKTTLTPQIREQVDILSTALEQEISDVDSTLTATNSGLLGIAEDILILDASFTEFHRMLATWRQLVVRFNMSAQLSGQLAPVDEQINVGRQRMNQLNDLGQQCKNLSDPIDTAPLMSAVANFKAVRSTPQ